MIANKTRYFLYFSVGLMVLALSCKTLIEPDIWWQITTGNWIINQHAVPHTDMLSYTYNNEPWVNIKWLAEVCMSFIARYFGPETLPLFSGLLLLPGIYLLFKTKYSDSSSSDKTLIPWYTFYAFILFILIISHRISGRPEIVSYLFTCVYAYIFAQSQKDIRYLLALPFLQCIWTNSHEAYGVGIVMIFVYTLVSFLLNSHSKKIYYPATFIFALFAMWFNPIGFKIYEYTWKLYTQLNQNQFTTELLGADNALYWDFFSIANLLCAIICFIYIIRCVMDSNYNLKKIHAQIPIYVILLLVAFFYLSIKSNRNIPFFQIIAFPIYTEAMKPFWSKPIFASIKTYTILFCILYIGIVSNVFYKLVDTHNEFGLGVSPRYNPIGAVQVLKPLLKKDDKVFSDFLSSSFALHEMYPTYKSYIDLRDLDVFPPAFFKNCMVLYQAPETQVSETQTIWQMADSIDQFAYVLLLNQPDFIPLHQYLFQSNNFQLLYADANSVVYKRTKEKKQVDVFTLFSPYKFYKQSKVSTIINKIINPFYTPIQKKEYPFEEQRDIFTTEYI